MYWDTPYQPKKAVAATLPFSARGEGVASQEMQASQPQSKSSELVEGAEPDLALTDAEAEVASSASSTLRELGEGKLEGIASRSTCRSPQGTPPEEEAPPETPREVAEDQEEPSGEEDDTWEAMERRDRGF